jgi:C1A family cysteine protease
MIYQLAVASVIAFSGVENAQKFAAYKTQHNKVYADAAAEEKAFAAFVENEKIIQEHNAKKLSWTLGHNKYSDMTWSTFSTEVMSELHLNRNPKNARRVHITQGGNAIADEIDWTTQGAVTPVKDQSRCGSCWAFSTTGAIEGALATSSEAKLISLSEEQLVQCDHNGDQGCNGGLMDNAFEFVEGTPLCTETDYPYTSGGGQTGTCVKGCSGAVTVTGFSDVPAKDEDALKSAVSKQPVSIAIEADKSAFQLYKSGILDSAACGTNLDHGVLIVGYGTDDATDYWKIKNSWGATWGEDGYIRMIRDKNMCGLAQQASYPTGAKTVAPTPPTPPSPPPPPTPPGPATHYGDPADGCLSDELEVTIQGVDGDFCTPQCNIIKSCPVDVPTGVTAEPQCALQDSASPLKKYCALICSPALPIANQKAADAQCGETASCKSVSLGMGLCTYDD